MNNQEATQPLIIKLGGAAIDDAPEPRSLFRALAALHHTNPNLALVHGGGAAVDRLLAKLNLPVTRIGGIRVTPEDQIDHVVSILAGLTNTTLVAALAAAGARPVGLSLADANLTTARLLDPALGRVGEITGGDPALLETLWNARLLPVISSIAADENAKPLNVNADDAAASIARITTARALVLLTDVPGVLDENAIPIANLSPDRAEALIASGVIQGGMTAKVRAAIRAADIARCPTLITSWKDPDALAALASDNEHTPGTTIAPPMAAASPKESHQ